MRIMTQDELNTYQEYMINPTLTKAAPGKDTHIEDHNLIAEALSLLVPIQQMSAVKTGDNAWNLDGDTLTDADLSGFLDNPEAGHMAVIVPNDWQGASSAPVNTSIDICHIGLYGLMVELSVLKSRLESLTNPE